MRGEKVSRSKVAEVIFGKVSELSGRRGKLERSVHLAWMIFKIFF